MIIGRSWGQGAQHSQSFQSLFAHIPGLVVIMPASADAVLESYTHAIKNYRGPVISIEHRILYDYKFKSHYDANIAIENPFSSRLIQRGSDVTIVATSIMVIESLRVSEYLSKEYQIQCEIIDLHSVSHYDSKMILDSVKKTGKLVIADTSWKAYGVCAEITRLICEEDPALLKKAVVTLGMQPTPCPTTKTLENLFYPDDFTFIKKVIELVKGKKVADVLQKQNINHNYTNFKGPF